MKEQIAVLVDLQAIDTELEVIRRTLGSIPEKLEELDRELDVFQNDLDNEEAALDALSKQYRSHDSDVRSRRDKIKKSQAKLMSVKSNKEYHAMLKEIEETEKINDDTETEMLELLDKIESSENDVKEKKKTFQTAKIKIEAQKQLCVQSGEEKREKLRELETRRDEIAGGIAGNLMEQFNRTQKIVSGPAIVPSVKAVCKGCNMNIPPQMHNDLRQSDNLNFCPFCHRIIYWKAEEAPE